MPILYPGIITLFAVILLLVLSVRVSLMRNRHHIDGPAMTGNAELERAIRVHMNTVEQFVVFLPMLWLFAVLIDDVWAAVLGLIWLIGRIVYAVSYMRDPASRAPGMILTGVPTLLLTLGVAWGLIVLIAF